ncbi:MAG: sigma 54-dependent Fis family transcriptional regulator [Myxococcaceae bacterium]|nr:sigma 54-dependent Fis family transcriptional regulator [Myxococcaceae bacterium]
MTALARATKTITVSYRGKTAVKLADVRLKVQTGRAVQERKLDLSAVTVGSDPACDVVVDDAAVSRRHCVVQLGEKGVSVRDAGSRNGVVMNGARIVEAFIEPGHVLELGDSKLWLETGRAPTELALWPSNHFGELYGESLPMRTLFAALGKALESDATVLLLGETGTGKDAASRALHELGPRKAGPYVVCDCGALAAELVEAELFGSLKGAFSGATQDRMGLLQAAHGGTLFLDEIGELPLPLQTRLLRVLETRRLRPVGASADVTVDLRVVAATHRDLRAAVKARTFREDLYYRLAVLEVRLPPLRERRDDIPKLVDLFLSRSARPKTGALPPSVLAMLEAHTWPGNLRELRNVVERLAVTGEAPVFATPTGAPVERWHPARADALARFEQEHLRRALKATSGNFAAAARMLGVSRQLLHQVAARHGLEP